MAQIQSSRFRPVGDQGLQGLFKDETAGTVQDESCCQVEEHSNIVPRFS